MKQIQIKPKHNLNKKGNKAVIELEEGHSLSFRDDVQLVISSNEYRAVLDGVVQAIRAKGGYDTIEIYPRNYERYYTDQESGRNEPNTS
jgi:hypothetical protein